MNHRMITLCQLVVAVGIALVVPLAAQAQPVLDDFDGIPWNSMRARGPAPGDPTPSGRGGDISWNSPTRLAPPFAKRVNNGSGRSPVHRL